MLTELKSSRAMKELLRQTAAYAEILEHHRVAAARLAGAVPGRKVTLAGPVRRWIVWPRAGAVADPREAAFRTAGVRLVGYCPTTKGYEFSVGEAPLANP